uniref:Immunoglobulin superfamily containing leucine rich repeat 2 n=1 Tax=Catharus ustulatus TaxID=91951 RepID=A0A8C3UK12_CATUS
MGRGPSASRGRAGPGRAGAEPRAVPCQGDMAPLLALLLAALLGSGRACPEPCACVDKYAHQFADCAYKELQAVPAGLPSNVTTLSLSANKISSLPRGAFAEVTQVSSLWLAHNEIATIEPGALAVLVQLKNLDISHNQIVEFPWQDLRNLSALQLLKMNNNRMAAVPLGAFRTLKDLRSLRINNNRFTTLECQVQVVFTTKKEIPSLIIIVVVSIFLLLLATLPLLGATWCHLLAKLQAKPYKLIMKAQNPDQMEKRMAADFDPRASYLESEKNFGPAETGEAEDDEEEEEEAGDEEGARWRRGREGEGAAELEREESVAASSMAESQSKGGAEEFEVRSEYSDKLPLGAEAVTISPEINGNYRQRPR